MPKHGSWLNVAEILLNILTKQCLRRRLDSIEKVTAELNKWAGVRNAGPKKIDWQFRTSKARIKLKSLYPDINYSKSMIHYTRPDRHSAHTIELTGESMRKLKAKKN